MRSLRTCHKGCNVTLEKVLPPSLVVQEKSSVPVHLERLPLNMCVMHFELSAHESASFLLPAASCAQFSPCVEYFGVPYTPIFTVAVISAGRRGGGAQVSQGVAAAECGGGHVRGRPHLPQGTEVRAVGNLHA